MACDTRRYLDATRVMRKDKHMRLILAIAVAIAAWALGCSDDGVYDHVDTAENVPDAGEIDAAVATDKRDTNP